MFFQCLLILTAFFLVNCSSGPKLDSNTVEGSFAVAERYEKDERYEEAIAQYNQVKNKYPYSHLAVESEMHIANIYFKREDFPEAQGAYQTFKELHPSHPQSDYVTYQLAMSLFHQLPPTIDRDLSLSDKALIYFDEILTSFPKSEYLKNAQEHKTKILRMQAEKELYIARFYFIRDFYDSALTRYEEFLKKFPDSAEFEPRALYGACVSASHLKDSGKAQSYLEKLVSRYSTTKEAQMAKKEIRNAN